MQWSRGFAFCCVWIAACGGVAGEEPDAGLGDATPSSAQLLGLDVGGGELEPPFDPAVTSYTVALPFYRDDVSITPTAPAEHFIEIDGSAVDSGEPSDPLSLDLGTNSVAVSVVGFGLEDQTYTVTIERGREVITFAKASNADANDQFGFSIAASGDLLAVGALSEASASIGVNSDQSNNGLVQAGAVYVFSRQSDTWVQEAYIKPLVVGAGDTFGRRVALDGDTLVVGASSEDSIATGINGNANDDTAASAGAVWVFVRSGAGTWSQQAFIKASNTGASDQFGESISIAGDTLVVGAPGEDSVATTVNGNQLDNTASASGAAYVFVRNGAAWQQQAYLKASNAAPGDTFGRAVAVSGDTVAVGADGEDSAARGIDGVQASDAALSSGAVYVFTRAGTAWSQQAYVKSSNSETSDVFGRSLALDGDTLVVSAEGEDSNATGVDGNQADNASASSGAAYVFARSAGLWEQQAYLKASNTGPSDLFAAGISLEGDALVVGARFEDSTAAGLDGNQADNGTTNAGSAYVFRRTGATWRQTNYLKSSAPGPSDDFGFGVALSGDVVVSAARLEDSSSVGVGGAPNEEAPTSGAIFIFE